MPKKELLDTAMAALRRAMELTEKVLDGIPIPAAKGTITALLQVIDEAQVCIEILHRFYHLYRDCRERPPTQNSAMN